LAYQALVSYHKLVNRTWGEEHVADPINVLGFAGSLRQRSYNRAALRAAVELAPAGMTIETFDIAPIPVYNEDVKQQGFPPVVRDFREKIRTADALLIVTPEYNHSIPGVLKNAIDWASRPPEQPFNHKPIAIMGASPGRLGTVRAQEHLRACFVFLNGLIMTQPEVLIGNAAQAFDDDLRLKDQDARGFVAKLLESLADWTRRLARP
jgi:chromate reductase, NAD(P)H dehydrogenase (quinone)